MPLRCATLCDFLYFCTNFTAMYVRLTVIITAILSALLLTCCNNNEDASGQSYSYLNKATKLLSERKIDLAALYVDSIRSHSICDTPEIREARADLLRSWVDTYNLDEDSARVYAYRAFNVMNKYRDRFPGELSGLASVLAFDYIYTQPDSSLYYADLCLELEEQNKDLSKILEVSLYKAEVYRDDNRFDECLSMLDRIQSITDTVSVDRLSQSDIGVMLYVTIESANMACFVGDFRRCNNFVIVAARWFDFANSVDDKLLYLERRARIHYIQSQYLQADKYSRRLNDMALANGEVKYRINALVLQALVRCRDGQIAEAAALNGQVDSLLNVYPSVRAKINKDKVLLDSELASFRGDFDLANSLLADSIDNQNRDFERDLVMSSQQVYYLAQKNYKAVYDIECLRKFYRDSVQTNVISRFDQRENRIAHDVNEQLRAKLHEQEEALNSQAFMLFIERMIFASVVLIISCGILYSIRRNTRNTTQRIEVEKRRLEAEISDKISALEQQKEMFQRVNQRISDSVVYAERIQHSIMPTPEALNNYDIDGSFIFYSPLDVVSGDFYWFDKKGSNLLVACADCTGHGIPGAFMSMIASTTINEVVAKSADDVTPAEILEALDARIIENLAHNTTESGASKDGLDIAMVSINLDTLEVIASAARRPVYLTKDQDVIQINGAKRSIGDVEPLIRKRAFVNETYQLHRGDTIYMYSDGYSDQFGGPKGDKMKNSKVKRFLRAIHDDDIDEQSLTIQELFTQWKGNYPQTDDVLFIGIKL